MYTLDDAKEKKYVALVERFVDEVMKSDKLGDIRMELSDIEDEENITFLGMIMDHLVMHEGELENFPYEAPAWG